MESEGRVRSATCEISHLSRFVLRTLPLALCTVSVACSAPAPAPPPAVARWTAFRADLRTMAGGVERRGRFYRRADGSTRRETLGPDGSPAFITIENRAAGRFYSLGGGVWSAQPLEPGAVRPPRTADFPDATPERAAHEGLAVVKVITPAGAVLRRAPALDFVPVVEEHSDPPLRVELTGIRREDPPSTLFEPPPGVRVESLPWKHR